MKNKAIILVTSIWAVLSALNESGVLDLLPFEDENISKWIKWIVATIVVIVNAVYFKPNFKSIGGGGIKNPPKK